MKVILRGTVVQGDVRQPVSKAVEFDAAPALGDKIRVVGGYAETGVAVVEARYWHTDGALELQLGDMQTELGLSASILAGQGWELRG